MRKITLVCSVHRENGLCNTEELLKLLLAIKPAVVFHEVRPSDHWSLEAQAVARYNQFRSSQQVHVDRYEMPFNSLTDIKNDVDRVFDCVAQRSEEYGLLEREIDSSVNHIGFRYLNSPAFATQSARKSEIEYETIIGTHDQGLIRALQRWRHINQSRELQMAANIYEFCRSNTFDIGVFLVGGAHRTGIEKEIEKKYASAEADLISWIFAFEKAGGV